MPNFQFTDFHQFYIGITDVNKKKDLELNEELVFFYFNILHAVYMNVASYNIFYN